VSQKGSIFVFVRTFPNFHQFVWVRLSATYSNFISKPLSFFRNRSKIQLLQSFLSIPLKFVLQNLKLSDIICRTYAYTIPRVLFTTLQDVIPMDRHDIWLWLVLNAVSNGNDLILSNPSTFSTFKNEYLTTQLYALKHLSQLWCQKLPWNLKETQSLIQKLPTGDHN